MSSALSAFNWRGQPSEIAASIGRTPTLINFAKPHPLRNSEAQKVGSKSRNPTANISERGRVG
jgi:hypothetical protein